MIRILVMAFCIIMPGIGSMPANADRIVTEKTVPGVWYGFNKIDICAKLMKDAESQYKILEIIRDCECEGSTVLSCYVVLRVDE
jgi:hypothetical protein